MNLFNSNLERVCAEASYITRCFTIPLICRQHRDPFDPDTQLPRNSVNWDFHAFYFYCALPFLLCATFGVRRSSLGSKLSTLLAVTWASIVHAWRYIYFFSSEKRRPHKYSSAVEQKSMRTYFNPVVVLMTRRTSTSVVIQIISYFSESLKIL
jgi:hypothetical protein